MNLADVTAVLYLIVFVAFIYMVKAILDSERILDRHPYFKNTTLRIFLIMDVASPLVIVLKPELFNEVNMVLLFGLSGTFFTVAYIYNRHIIKVGITLTKPASNLVSAIQYLSFHSDRYTSIGTGIMLRRVISATNILPDMNEEQIRPYLSLFDFDKEIVLVVIYGDGGEFDWHKHPGYEKYYMVEGAAEILPGVILNKGDSYRIEPGIEHYFKEVRPGLVLVGLQKD